MSTSNTLRKKAERAYLEADAIEEEERASRLQREADQASKRAFELQRKANSSDDETDAVLGAIFLAVIILVAIGVFYY